LEIKPPPTPQYCGDFNLPQGRNFIMKSFPWGKLFAELVGGFNLPNPDLSGPKGRNFCHNKLSPFYEGSWSPPLNSGGRGIYEQHAISTK